MKKNILSIILALAAITASEQIKVEVSETVELMNILARTAGYPEYSMDLAGQYTKDTEAWFTPYKQHAAVVLAQELRNKYGIGYERVMNMAVHLNIEKGKLTLIGNRAELNNGVYDGWKNVDVDDFVDKLNQFYKDTRFHKFFEQHRAFYDEGVKNFETEIMPKFHQEWYTRFYGTEASGQFHIIINFTYGRHNNGVNRQLPGQPFEVFAILGYQLNPTTAQPQWFTDVLVHEFNHSFVNPLLDNATNAALIEKVGQRLYMWSQPEMNNQAYNDWRIVINESIVRAAVFIYMMDNGLMSKQTFNEMFNETWRNGFRWTPELVNSLRYYANNRDLYPTLNDYYPEIARSLSKYIEDEATRMQNALK
ncbi:MAG: DUF4932 domain-containing protein [Prevotella sp.]|nr:DUF4932 domain-containing protein [Prevotella sp.]